MDCEPRAFNRAGGHYHGALRTDSEEFSLAADIGLDGVHVSSCGVQFDHMRERHQKEPPVGIIASREIDVLANRLEQQGRLLYLSKLNRPEAGALPCTANGATSTPLLPRAVSILGTAAAAATSSPCSARNRSPEIKSVAGTTPVSLTTSV